MSNISNNIFSFSPELPKTVKRIISQTLSHHVFYFKVSLKSKEKVSVGTENTSCDIRISDSFIEILEREHYDQEQHFKSEPLLRSRDGSPDYVGTASYLLNHIQEYSSGEENYDNFGRWKPEKTLQHRFNLFSHDLVTEYLENSFSSISSKLNIPFLTNRSSVILSHDIDIINKAPLQEVKASLREIRILSAMKTIAKYFLEGPSYRNMNKIMDIHDEFGMKSIFFWLVSQGYSKSPYGQEKIKNSDYNISSKKIRKEIEKISSRNFDQGLHRSNHRISIDQENAILNIESTLNRNHYLLFRIPEHFNELENSQINIDFSSGFGPQFGHRNSFSRPYIPFNIQNNSPYSFLEVPLQLMDTTFKYYRRNSASETENLIIDFLDEHKYNCMVSILWHNDMFSPIKNPHWLKCYKTVLAYLKEEGFTSINATRLETIRQGLASSFHNNS